MEDYNEILDSIQRRSTERGSWQSSTDQDFWQQHPHDQSQSSSSLLSNNIDSVAVLEADLRLAAQLGVQLLEAKTDLEKKVAGLETANQKLLDRLTESIKESSQLQRRFEETVSSLEQEESNNRALLISLESSRKAVSRLQAESTKSQSQLAKHKALLNEHQDLKQELALEKRAGAGSLIKLRKQGERIAELEDRLNRAITDLAEVRQVAALKNETVREELVRTKTKLQADISRMSMTHLRDSPEVGELLKFVESLVEENGVLRGERDELDGMIQALRDEHVLLKNDLETQHKLTVEAGDSLVLRESQDIVHPIPPPATTSRIPDSWTGQSFSPSSIPQSFSHSLGYSRSVPRSGTGFLERSLPTSLTHARHKSQTTGTSGSGSGVIPIGRGTPRRSFSVDVNTLGLQDRRSSSASSGTGHSEASRKHSQATSAQSGDEGDGSFKTRHRPLSLVLNPSIFSPTLETPLSRSHTQSKRIIFRGQRESAISPTSNYNFEEEEAQGGEPNSKAHEQNPGPIVVTVDSATQTSRPNTPMSFRRFANERLGETRRASSISASLPDRSDLYPFGPTGSISGSSDPDPDRTLIEFGLYLHPGSAGLDTRTAALGKLIGSVQGIFGKLKAADVKSQESRLKKFGLRGDVGFLAGGNLKDLMSEIENLRSHFRRILEREIKELGSSVSESSTSPESLVLRRDFIALIKLLRDLLFEIARLRGLVNMAVLDPSLAGSLREMDNENVDILEVINAKQNESGGGGGFLAPIAGFARFLGGALTSEPEPTQEATTTNSAVTNTTATITASRPGGRLVSKSAGSSAISSATVNVEFGKGLVRKTVMTNSHGTSSEMGTTQYSHEAGSLSKRKSPNQVRRELGAIFNGSLPPVSKSPRDEDWVFLKPGVGDGTTGKGRTADALLDSIPHAINPMRDDTFDKPTLLERQLRPRGLSDSSIRSTFISHSKILPQQRLLSKVMLALSSESRNEVVVGTPVMSRFGKGRSGDALRQLRGAIGPSENTPLPGKSILAPASSTSNQNPTSTEVAPSLVAPISAVPIPLSRHRPSSSNAGIFGSLAASSLARGSDFARRAG